MAQEYLDSTDNMKLQEMSRLRQESKLLDMDIIVSWMAIPLNRPFNFRPRGTTAFPRIVWCCALVFHNWKIKLWHNETANLIGLDFLRRRFYHFSLIFFLVSSKLWLILPTQAKFSFVVIMSANFTFWHSI